MGSARTNEWTNAPAVADLCSLSIELAFPRNHRKVSCTQDPCVAMLHNAASAAAWRTGQTTSEQLLVAYFDYSADKLHSSCCSAMLPSTTIYKQKSEDCFQDFTLGLRVFTRGRREGA